MRTLARAQIATPLGSFTYLTDADEVVAAGFSDGFEPVERSLDARTRDARDPLGIDHVLRAYFEEEQVALDRIPARAPTPTFHARVWHALRAVPAGETVTYAELAAAAGAPRAARAAGTACARNLVAVLTPCHRVVRSGGALGGYFYGLERKRALLDLERSALRRTPDRVA